MQVANSRPVDYNISIQYNTSYGIGTHQIVKGQALYTVNVRAETPVANAREDATEMNFISRPKFGAESWTSVERK